jgi:hypothetical protein
MSMTRGGVPRIGFTLRQSRKGNCPLLKSMLFSDVSQLLRLFGVDHSLTSLEHWQNHSDWRKLTF